MTAPGIPTYAIRAAGAVLGIAAALALVAAARPGSSVPGFPASIHFTITPPGTLAVTPAPPAGLLATSRLVPGGRRVSADLTVRNQSGVTLEVGLRAIAAAHDLDGLLRIRIASCNRVLADTTLQGLRHSTEIVPALRSGAAQTLHVEAWLPSAITSGYEGMVVDGSFALTARHAGAGT